MCSMLAKAGAGSLGLSVGAALGDFLPASLAAASLTLTDCWSDMTTSLNPNAWLKNEA